MDCSFLVGSQHYVFIIFYFYAHLAWNHCLQISHSIVNTFVINFHTWFAHLINTIFDIIFSTDWSQFLFFLSQ